MLAGLPKKSCMAVCCAASDYFLEALQNKTPYPLLPGNNAAVVFLFFKRPYGNAG
jgi:hypothetical protein